MFFQYFATSTRRAYHPRSKKPGSVPSTVVEPYYRSRITIDRVALHDVPKGFYVTPGMPVTNDIKVGKRTVLGYLLGSVVPIGREPLREP